MYIMVNSILIDTAGDAACAAIFPPISDYSPDHHHRVHDLIALLDAIRDRDLYGYFTTLVTPSSTVPMRIGLRGKRPYA